MLLFFLNTSKEKRDAEIKKVFEGFREPLKKEDLTISGLSFFAGGNSMFGGVSLYESVYLFSEAESEREELINTFSDLEDSSNIFVFVENEISADEKSKIKKIARVFLEGVKTEGEKVNPFTVVNKLSDRDKLGSWVAFRKLLNKGEDPNGILGILFWAVKDGFKALKGEKASRTGTMMKKNYGEGELQNQSDEIIRIYHESKTGKEEIESGIEKFILDSSNKSR